MNPQPRLWAQPDFECGITLPFPSKARRSQEIINELANTFYGAFPQRFIAGLPAPTTTEESPLTEQKFTNAINVSITVDSNGIYPMIKTSKERNQFAVLRDTDVPGFLKAVIDGSSKFKRETQTVTMDGKPSVKVGEGGAAGIVYKPTTEDQAARNLNFALANLAAFTEWETTGRAAAAEAKKVEEKKQAALKALREAAEEMEKREAKRRADKLAEDRKRTDALRYYNRINDTFHYTWSSIPFMGEYVIKHWIDLSEADKRSRFNAINPLATRIGNPYDGGVRPVRSWL